MNSNDNNKRIAKNTIFLYIRMFITLLVGLYTSRVVLATIGISDYGLYNVVGGVVAMFGFLNSALSTSTQRFLNFELGTGDRNKLKLVFSTALLQHILLVCIVLVLAETVGLWFVVNKLNIPEGRETASFWCYQFSIIAVCIQIFQLPFMSSIIAHEKMDVYAYVSIFDVAAKLILVFLITVSPLDKLITYAFLILLVYIIDTIFYNVYSQRKFEEVRISLKTEKLLFKEMLGFSGWNVIGMLASTMNNYGLNILFNLFFGTVVNAARGISYQVNGMVYQFSSNFQLAAKPQAIKYYANNQISEMKQLVINSARYSALLLLIIAIPLALEIDYLLYLWLGEYPEHTVAMVRIVLLHSVVASMTTAIIMAIHASGKLKMVAITAGSFNLLLLPVNYFLLKLGCSAEVTMLVNVVGSFIEAIIELCWLKYYIKFSVLEFLTKVYLFVLILGLIMLSLPALLHYLISWQSPVLRLLIVGFSSLLFSLAIILFGVVPKQTRNNIFLKLKLMLRMT